MHYFTIFRLLGVLLVLFSQTMLSPIIVDVIYGERVWEAFAVSYVFTGAIGLGLWLQFYNARSELKIRDGFLLVVACWLTICFFSSLPLLLTLTALPSSTDAIFEAVSGITTTGASVVKNLDALPHAIIFYRQQLQFLGGIGIVVLAVAIFPMLGVGGMQLFQAETPGPMKDKKLTPRITQTAKVIWSIYLLLNALCTLCFYFAGMDFFSALTESFGTVSTGGFAIHDASFAYYESEVIRIIACIFMFLGGTSFALHFYVLKHKSWQFYRQDEEFRLFLGIILSVGIIMSYTLIRLNPYEYDFHTVVVSFFTTISMLSTTGLEADNQVSWMNFTPFLGMILMITGGCAGSTSGGLKILRVLLLYKHSRRETFKVLHPQAVLPIKLGKNLISDNTLHAVWGFVGVFVALYLFFALVLMFDGHGLEESFGLVSATLTNSGYGLDHLGSRFSEIDIFSKWLLIFIMIIGRLEIFSLLIIFTKAFWKK